MSHTNTALKPVLVVAIDFGTCYSGWAFSFKSEYESDPTRIHDKLWTGGQVVSKKTPTTVLIKPDGATFDSFGHEAETRYADLASEDTDEHQRWYFFRRFKMKLHEKMTFDRSIHLEDETQKSLPAETVFSLAIRYLKADVLETCSNSLRDFNISDDEITWVLTIPAIWSDPAKQFMREAAVEAGIATERLIIALEPETASIFCSLLLIEKKVEGGGMKSFQPGARNMVMDAGGGTVDLTIHEVLPEGKFKELHKACGGVWGGSQVDEAYKKFIINLVGNPVFLRFKRENKQSYLEMFRDFELKKREIAPDRDGKVYIRFPGSLREIFKHETGKDFRDAIQQTKYGDKVSLRSDMLVVDASIMHSLFSHAIQTIVSQMKQMMEDECVPGVSNILMVGGFSESKMLQNAITSNFPTFKVIIPMEASLVVLKGAVVYGHNPTSIVQRVSKYTYGVSINVPFNSKIHDIGKRKEYKHGAYCDEIFDKHVEIGETVALNEISKETTYVPIREDQSHIGFAIYASKQKSPMYVTDEGCWKLGYVRIDILDKSVPKDQRDVVLSMMFGGTEIEVAAKEKRTGMSTKATVNFCSEEDQEGTCV